MTTNQGLEDDLFAFLCHRYVQRQDSRQAQMGLRYTTAETRDLARTLTAYFVGRVDASLEKTRAMLEAQDHLERIRALARHLDIKVRQAPESDQHHPGKWFATYQHPDQILMTAGPFASEKQAIETAVSEMQHG